MTTTKVNTQKAISEQKEKIASKYTAVKPVAY
jgi:hypothetical protein